jgi:hypothetical protein
VYTAMVNSFYSYRLLGVATSASESLPRKLRTPSNHTVCSLKCVCARARTVTLLIAQITQQ